MNLKERIIDLIHKVSILYYNTNISFMGPHQNLYITGFFIYFTFKTSDLVTTIIR